MNTATPVVFHHAKLNSCRLIERYDSSLRIRSRSQIFMPCSRSLSSPCCSADCSTLSTLITPEIFCAAPLSLLHRQSRTCQPSSKTLWFYRLFPCLGLWTHHSELAFAGSYYRLDKCTLWYQNRSLNLCTSCGTPCHNYIAEWSLRLPRNYIHHMCIALMVPADQFYPCWLSDSEALWYCSRHWKFL